MKLFPRSIVAAVSRTLASTSKEAARALPDSKGGETAKQLQTYRTEIYTYFTVPDGDTQLLYSAENWVRIKLTLETAGPVAVGQSATLNPVLSGRGRLLDTDVEFEAYLPKGTRLFVVSESVNRISVTIEPVPWLEQLANQQESTTAQIVGAIHSVGAAIVAAIGALKPASPVSMKEVTSPTGQTAAQQGLKPLPTRLPTQVPTFSRARLTPFRRPGKMR